MKKGLCVALLACCGASWASNGLFKQDFVVPAEEGSDVPALVSCGAEIDEMFRETFADVDMLVVCSTFNSAPLPDGLAKPADCELDWQATFVLPKKGEAYVDWSCRGDTDFGMPDVTLEDGQSVQGEGFECTRQGEGVMCKNSEGFGFTVSREVQKVF